MTQNAMQKAIFAIMSINHENIVTTNMTTCTVLVALSNSRLVVVVVVVSDSIVPIATAHWTIKKIHSSIASKTIKFEKSKLDMSLSFPPRDTKNKTIAKIMKGK